jgi:hypothetical protein
VLSLQSGSALITHFGFTTSSIAKRACEELGRSDDAKLQQQLRKNPNRMLENINSIR